MPGFLHADTGSAQLTTSGTTVSVTLGNPVSQGDLLTGICGGPVAPVSANITDTAGNTWAVGTTSNFQTVIWCLASNAAPSGITVTMTLGTGGTLFLGIDRFSAPGPVLPASAPAAAGANTGTSGTTPSVATPAGSLLWGALHTDTSSITFTPGTDGTGDTAAGGFSSVTASGSAFSQYVLAASSTAAEGLSWTSSAPVTATAGQVTAAFVTAPPAVPVVLIPPGLQSPMTLAVPSPVARPAAPGTVTSPPLIVSGFGTFPQVPVNSVILSVIANVTQHGSDAQVTAPSYELWDGTSAIIGTPRAGTASVSAGNTDSAVFTGAAWSQLATLQLRIYGTSQGGNSGATVAVDAAALAVVWAPNRNAAVTPGTLAVVPAFPAPQASSGTTVSPGALAVVPAFPAAAAGFLAATVLPPARAVIPAFPAPSVSAGVTVSPAVLAVVPVFPAISDVTGPGYATAETGGGWASPGNVTGSPDGNYATWTVP